MSVMIDNGPDIQHPMSRGPLGENKGINRDTATTSSAPSAITLGFLPDKWRRVYPEVSGPVHRLANRSQWGEGIRASHPPRGGLQTTPFGLGLQ